MRQKHSKS